MSAVRVAERAIEGLKVRIGLAAGELAAVGSGRGAHALFLGDGRSVRGSVARREVRRSGLVAELDLVAAALDAGRIGGAQVDLFAQAASSLEPAQRRALNTAELVAAAAEQPVDVFARHIRRAVDQLRGDDGAAESVAQRQASSWRSWVDHQTGMGHVHGEFDPERFEAIQNAVEGQVTKLANRGGVQKTANLAAQAAFELLTGQGGGGGALPHIGVIVDWETFTRGDHAESVRETTAGHPVSSDAVSRLACNAVVQPIALDGRGVPLRVGRRRRTATNSQWLAIRAIYRSCAWHGCDRPLSWCQLHHVHEWEHGGPTDLCNLVPLCGEHHHAVHEGGWTLKLWDDRRLDMLSPDGASQATSYPDRVTRTAAPRPMVRPRARVVARTRRPPSKEPAQPAGP